MKFFRKTKKKNEIQTVNVVSLGLAAGVSVGLYVFLIGILASFGWGEALVTITADWYLGFGPSVEGAIIGSVWGFLDGFIGGFLLAAFYNFFQQLRK